MLMISITIASLIALSVVSYKYYASDKKALDVLVKYKSTKAYADGAAQRILKLVEDNNTLSASIVKLESQHQSVSDKLTAERRKNEELLDFVKKVQSPSEVKAKAPTATMKAKTPNTENSPRRGRPNKA